MDRRVVGIITVLIHCFVLAASYLGKSETVFACPGKTIRTRCPVSPLETTMITVKSVTIFSTTELQDKVAENCNSTIQCERKISKADPGLSDEYKHFYEWCLSNCTGYDHCSINVPEYHELVGDTKFGRNCPEDGIKYLSGVLVHFQCVYAENITTVVTPLPTPARTRPTTPSTTTPFPVQFRIYLPGLSGRERVLLGVAVGLAVAILIVLLIVLYCYERWQKKKRLGKLLRMLGRPKAMDDGFDDLSNYATREAWGDMTDNAGALSEYTGVKPDEFLTIDKKAMENSGLIYSDHIGTMASMGKTNTVSSTNVKKPIVEPGTGHHNGPVDYETDENLELERRMAEALARQQHGEDAEGISKH